MFGKWQWISSKYLSTFLLSCVKLSNFSCGFFSYLPYKEGWSIIISLCVTKKRPEESKTTFSSWKINKCSEILDSYDSSLKLVFIPVIKPEVSVGRQGFPVEIKRRTRPFAVVASPIFVAFYCFKKLDRINITFLICKSNLAFLG